MPIVQNSQASILKYFDRIIPTTSDSSERTNKQFSDIFDDHGDSPKIIKSKYFLNETIPT